MLSGGILSSLARFLFTDESFFTTMAENHNDERSADVMMAPTKPGGILVHKLTHGDHDDDILLTSGSYIASDTHIKVSSEMQGFSKSYFSNSGLFLLRASIPKKSRSDGCVAFGAYGSIHKYTVAAGEIRSVDNGHLVAWSASMKFSVGLATIHNQPIHKRLANSMTSGEGLMCHFQGPGIVYLQSHKPDLDNTKKSKISVVKLGLYFFGFLLVFATVFYIWLILKSNDVWQEQHNQKIYNDRERREF